MSIKIFSVLNFPFSSMPSLAFPSTTTFLRRIVKGPEDKIYIYMINLQMSLNLIKPFDGVNRTFNEYSPSSLRKSNLILHFVRMFFISVDMC